MQGVGSLGREGRLEKYSYVAPSAPSAPSAPPAPPSPRLHLILSGVGVLVFRHKLIKSFF